MNGDSKNGPLTIADLLAIWQSATDSSYNEAFVEAGEGNGLEAYTQAFAQLARVSQAIDVTTQAMYIMPFSGQSNPPAAGEANATVTMQLTRTVGVDKPLVLGAGMVFFEEQTNDWGDAGSVPINTGRRYTLVSDFVFLPGDSGPFQVQAIAESPGYGYNNPLVGSIQVIDQVGTNFYHQRAKVAVVAGAVPPPVTSTVTVVSANEADTFIPDHVGQYVLFTAGANLGQIGRMLNFQGPDATVPRGSIVQLEQFTAIEAFSALTGTFILGETLQIKAGATVVGTATLSAVRAGAGIHTKMGFVLTSGTVVVGNTIAGVQSGAGATVSLVSAVPAWTTESGPTASWRVLDWVTDLGLSVANVTQPSGGCLGMLDAIGEDRAVPRHDGETDDAYRKRVHALADVVTPNAIRRALNRALVSIPWCFREVGTSFLPGFYYDRTGDALGDFYDYDSVICTGTVGSGSAIDPSTATGYQEKVEYRDSTGLVKMSGRFGKLVGGTALTFIRKAGFGSVANPLVWASGDVVVGLSSGLVFNVTSIAASPYAVTRRYSVYLDYTDMRAFFLIGVPRLSFGEFGFAWAGLPAGSPAFPYSFYDAAPYPDFYDGYPVGSGAFYRRAWQAVEKVRAGGVRFDLVLDDSSCS